MATGARVEIDAGDGWEDITGDVLLGEQITITRGRTDRGTRTDPGTCTLQLRNVDGKYTLDNPRSPYFGRIGRNTPVRVSVLGNSTVLRVVGNSASEIIAGATPAMSITGDLDIRIDAALDNWYTEGVDSTLELAGRFAAATNQRSWFFASRNGRPYLEWSPDGTTVITADGSTSPQATTGLGRRMAWRATLDVNNGSGGWTVTYFTAPTIAGPWTVLERVTGTGTTSVHAGTAALRVANATDFGWASPIGEVVAFELRNGIGGPIVAQADIASLAPGTTAWTDSAGNAWVADPEAEVTDRRVRFLGEASSWVPSRRLADGGHMTVTASGILRRLGQGAPPLQSTLRRQIPSGSPDAYWPMEDQTSATWGASPIAGVTPMFAEGVDWASSSSLSSSSPLPVVRSNTSRAGIWGVVPEPAGTPTAWQMQYVYRIDQVNTDPQTIIRVITTGTVTEWVIDQGATLTVLRAYDVNRALLFSHSYSTGTRVYGAWIEFRLTVRQSGGNVAWEIGWRRVGDPGMAATGAEPGTLGRVSAIGGPVMEVNGWSPELDGMAFGHIAVWHNDTQGRFDGALTAWAGETAATRMTRLAAEEGLSLTVYGLASETEQVGPQRIASLLDLFGDAADVDGGLLFERLDAVGLAYRPRASLYNQAPALELTYGQRHEVQPPLVPAADDAAVRNDITVQRTGGSSARVVREDGPMSIAPPPEGVGRYDEAVSRALYEDAQTEPHAAWLVHLGTSAGPRYPAVTVRLHKAPHLIDAVCAMRPGDRITIAEPPHDLPPETIDQLAMGYTEVIGVQTWEVVFNGTPGRPWLVAAVEDPIVGRVDTDGSELALSVDADDTTLSVATTSGELWVTAEPPLNSNSDFEQGLDGWSGNGASIAHVPAVSPAGGEWGMSVTPDGVAVFPHAPSSIMLVSAGQQYTVAGWMRCTVPRLIQLNTNWFTAAGLYLSTSVVQATVIADAWVWIQGTITAPATAARAELAPTIPDTPPTSHVLTVDLVTMRTTNVGESVSDFPWQIMVGGERMTVVGVNGISSPQTFTVVRGVNGFAGSHAAGTPVSLADPSYIAL